MWDLGLLCGHLSCAQFFALLQFIINPLIKGSVMAIIFYNLFLCPSEHVFFFNLDTFEKQ